MEELINSGSYRRGMRRASAFVVVMFAAWAFTLVNAVLFRPNMVPFAATTLFVILGVREQLRTMPRVLILHEGSFQVRYALGTKTFGIPNIQEAVFFKSNGPHGSRRATDDASVVYLNLLGGATKKLGRLDDPVADRFIEDLARQGCDVKIFAHGRPASGLSRAAHHPAT